MSAMTLHPTEHLDRYVGTTSTTSTPAPARLVSVPASADPKAPAPSPSSPRAATPGHHLVEVEPQVAAEMERWVSRYVQNALEIVAGERSAGQLARWNRLAVHQDLTRRAQLVTRARGGRPRSALPDAARAHVQRVHLSFLAPSRVEASVSVRQGARFRAVAAQFTWTRDRWVCEALEFC